MIGWFFAQIGVNGVVVAIGQILGSVGKTGNYWLLGFEGRAPYKRVLNADALMDFALFDTLEQRNTFLKPPAPEAPTAPAGSAAPAQGAAVSDAMKAEGDTPAAPVEPSAPPEHVAVEPPAADSDPPEHLPV